MHCVMWRSSSFPLYQSGSAYHYVVDGRKLRPKHVELKKQINRKSCISLVFYKLVRYLYLPKRIVNLQLRVWGAVFILARILLS